MRINVYTWSVQAVVDGRRRSVNNPSINQSLQNDSDRFSLSRRRRGASVHGRRWYGGGWAGRWRRCLSETLPRWRPQVVPCHPSYRTHHHRQITALHSAHPHISIQTKSAVFMRVFRSIFLVVMGGGQIKIQYEDSSRFNILRAAYSQSCHCDP